MAGGSKALGIVKSVPASQQEGTMKEQMTDFFIYTTSTEDTTVILQLHILSSEKCPSIQSSVKD